MHSEQPDTYGHKMGPMSTDVSAQPSCVCVYTLAVHVIDLRVACVSAEQPSEADRPSRRSADGWT